jgi:S-adenosylmethionine hydrolase
MSGKNLRNSMNIVSFLSDFGSEHGYVGSVKGVILTHNPAAAIIDISHQVESFNVREAAYILFTYYKYFPSKTVHLAVIDPGVGSDRDPIVIETSNYYFVGPDNGLFSEIISREAVKIYKIIPEKLLNINGIVNTFSATFHARDIFAPAAALLSKGVSINLISEKFEKKPVVFSIHYSFNNDVIKAEIMAVDRFGNLITNLLRDDFEQRIGGEIKEIRIKNDVITDLSNTYSDAECGQLLALWGSSGFLEISVNRGNASKILSCNTGSDKVAIIVKSR